MDRTGEVVGEDEVVVGEGTLVQGGGGSHGVHEVDGQVNAGGTGRAWRVARAASDPVVVVSLMESGGIDCFEEQTWPE